METVPVQITKELEIKEVLIVDDNLRSPGGSKPMQRKFKYQSTPEAAEYDAEYAERVHEKNLLERRRVILEFTKAEMEQPRINNKHRKRKQYERALTRRSMARRASRLELGQSGRPPVPLLRPLGLQSRAVQRPCRL